MTRPTESQLGIDVGTTHTVAALAGPDGRSQPLLFDASFLLPSAIYAEADGRLLVGRDAERSARLDPTRFEPNPKRRIDDGTVLLGAREYPVPDLLAALLRRAGDEAARVAGIMPARTVLTYPANWATSRRAVLADAAARAGLPAVTLVPEPIAAAAYFTTILNRTLHPGAALVVYDFGGGTFDTSVLRRRPDGAWDVLTTDGLPDVGGVDLDNAIIEHFQRTIGARDPERWRRLVDPEDDTARRRHRMLLDDVRAAKEQLSRASSAAVHVPLFDTDVYITREEFEGAARPYLQRTVDLTATTLQRAGVRSDQIGGLFMVGGSSRIPLVSTLLHHRLAVAPTLIEQPELVVALGSVMAVRPAPLPGPLPGHMPGHPPVPPAPPWMVAAPVSPGMAAPVSPGMASPVSPGMAPGTPPVGPPAAPMSPPSGPGAPISAPPTMAPPSMAPPTSSPPTSGPPTSGPPMPMSASPMSGPPTSGPPTSGAPAQAAFGAPAAPAPPPGGDPTMPLWPTAGNGAPPPPRAANTGDGGKRIALLAGIAVVILLIAGVGGVQLWRQVSDSSADDGNGGRGTTVGQQPDSTRTQPTGGDQEPNGGSTPTKPATVPGGSVEVNKTVWYAKFKLTFGKTAFERVESRGRVTVAVLMENLSSEDTRADLPIVLTIGDQQVDGDVREATLVGAGTKSNITIDFDMRELPGSLSSGSFSIGRGDEAKAIVPIGAGQLIAYEPRTVLTNTKVVHRDLTLNFKLCEVRGGFFSYHGQASKDHLALTCLVDVQYTGGAASGHYYGDRHFGLALPDGTEVGVTVGPNEALYSAAVVPDTYVGFMIKADTKGKCIIRVIDVHGGETRGPSNVYDIPITI